jgi:hypothetical protein
MLPKLWPHQLINKLQWPQNLQGNIAELKPAMQQESEIERKMAQLLKPSLIQKAYYLPH